MKLVVFDLAATTIQQSMCDVERCETVAPAHRCRKLGGSSVSSPRVHVPAGGWHGFRNEHGPAPMLLHFAPGASAGSLLRGPRSRIGRLDPPEYDAFMAEHDNFWDAE